MLAAGEERLAGIATTEVHQSILSLSPFRVFSRVSRAISSSCRSRVSRVLIYVAARPFHADSLLHLLEFEPPPEWRRNAKRDLSARFRSRRTQPRNSALPVGGY